MDTLGGLLVGWGVVTLLFLGLVFYRSRLTNKESDWIPLSNDAREDQAIEAQKVSEVKSHKLELPIRILGTISALMLLVIIGFWFYHGIMTPPAIPK
jgi:hypothetical protein